MANLHLIDATSLPWVPHTTFPGVYGRTVVDAQMGTDVEVKEICVAPGAEIWLHAHEGSAETFYILSGEGQLQLGHKFERCHPGSCVHAKAGAQHAVKNTGEDELHLLAIFTPPLARVHPPNPQESRRARS